MRIGIDLGGTKIETIVLDDQGDVRFKNRITTPANNYQAILDAIQYLIETIPIELRQDASIGMGIPGTIFLATGLVKNANTTCLIGQSLQEDLSQKLNQPIRIANDANCFAISEATDGAAKNASIIFGVIIGTGTGGGIVINKNIITGTNSICGEWGHNPLPWPKQDEQPGPHCYCGKTGCIETFLSGPGLTQDYIQHGGESLNPKNILAQAEQENVRANACLARYEDRLARALATVINILDPDVIVPGGGLSNIARLYKNVPQLWCISSDLI